eukprot:symbB.v1.2.021463.t1/scaffold1852.1/size98719/3
MLEKHKNLITWKDQDVSSIMAYLLVICLVISCLLPTKVIFAGLVAFTFYIGSLMGERKRQFRGNFLHELSKLGSLHGASKKVEFHGDELCSVLEENGITRLLLRDWCNGSFKTQFNLKSFDHCSTLAQLADLVVQSSPTIDTTPRRYRSWHSDVYGNFLDHVPSDSTDYDASCICYKLPFGAFPEIDVSELTTPTPGRKKMRSLKPEGLRGLCLEEEEEHVSDQPEGVVIEDVSEDFTTNVAYVEPEQRIRDVASPMRGTPAVGDMTISATGGIVEMAERASRERRSRRSATPVPMVHEVRRDLKGAVLDRLNDDNFGPEKLSELRYLGPVMVNRVMIKRRSGGFESLDEVHKILGMPHARKVVQSVEDSLRRNST